jgi:hypothetical protein
MKYLNEGRGMRSLRKVTAHDDLILADIQALRGRNLNSVKITDDLLDVSVNPSRHLCRKTVV